MTWGEVKSTFKRVTQDYEGQLIEYPNELHIKANNEMSLFDM